MGDKGIVSFMVLLEEDVLVGGLVARSTDGMCCNVGVVSIQCLIHPTRLASHSRTSRLWIVICTSFSLVCRHTSLKPNCAVDDGVMSFGPKTDKIILTGCLV